MSHQLADRCRSSMPSDPVRSDPHRRSNHGTGSGGRRDQNVFFALMLAVVVAALAVPSRGLAGEYHSNPTLLSWIPATCCVTNDCCWQVSENELHSLPDDQWQIRSTGQVRKRTDWSPDGKFYRCACDYDSVAKHWIKHQGANTRCIFVPMRTVSASFPSRRPAR